MKKIVILILFVLLCESSYSINKYYFYLDKNYNTQKELYSTLMDDGIKSTHNLFLWCCDCIMFYARFFGVSYDAMNLILFVIIQPTIIFILFISLIIIKIKYILYRKKTRCYA